MEKFPKEDLIYSLSVGERQIDFSPAIDIVLSWVDRDVHVLRYYDSKEGDLLNIWLPKKEVEKLKRLGARVLNLASNDMYSSEYEQYIDVLASQLDDKDLE